jgi:hypothetical protein
VVFLFKLLLEMPHSDASQHPYMPLYNKALEIFSLSKRISGYLRYDLSKLNAEGIEDPDIYLTGDIIQQSENLAPEILKAERSHKERMYYAQNVSWLSKRLYRTCLRLEQSNSNGKDFLPILKNELLKFRKLQRAWMLNL